MTVNIEFCIICFYAKNINLCFVSKFYFTKISIPDTL